MERLGATIEEIHGVSIPIHFPRAKRGNLALRRGVGVTRHPWGVLTIAGSDRYAFLNDTVTCRVPTDEGEVAYGFLLDPEGRIESDMYIVDAGDRYLCLTAPGTVSDIAATLGGRTFIQDVTVEDVTGGHAVLGVHGATATTKLTSVMPRGEAPMAPMSMSRGVVREEGVTIVRLDAPAGEPGFAVVCRVEDAGSVFDALVSLGALATPIGFETWLGLTLEAGTPLFNYELGGRTPNVCGQLGAPADLEKGCFIGQEVVARIANLASPRRWLIGVRGDALGDEGTPVQTPSGDGELTRVATSPTLGTDIAFAVVPESVEVPDTVTVDGDRSASVVELPFIEGHERSARIPRYDTQPSSN